MRNILITGLLFCIINAKSQTNFRAAKIVTDKGDTIYCSIKYTDWRINPEKFEFIRNSNSTLETIGINETKLVIIDSGETFKKYQVKKYTNLLDLNNLASSFNEDSELDTVFLKQVLKGNKFTLYMLNDGRKVHYFIEKPGGEPMALRYVMYKNDGLLVEVKTYVQQLSEFAQADSRLLNQLNRLNYNYESIVKISEKLNTQSSLSQNAYEDIKTKKFSRWYIGGGVLVTNVSNYAFGSTYFSRINFPANLTPIGEFGHELISRRIQQRFFCKVFLNVSHLRYVGNNKYSEAGSEYEVEYSLSALTSQIGLGFNFMIVKKPIGLSVGGGSAFNINYWYKNQGFIKNITANNSGPMETFNIKNTGANLFVCTELHLKVKNSIALVHRLKADQTLDPRYIFDQNGWSLMYVHRFLKNKK